MNTTIERAGVRMHGKANTRNAGHVPPIKKTSTVLKAMSYELLTPPLSAALPTALLQTPM